MAWAFDGASSHDTSFGELVSNTCILTTATTELHLNGALNVKIFERSFTAASK